MKPVVAKSLVLDAYYQVLDNRIFRFLLGVVGFLVALSFVFGFRTDRIEVLWGWQAIEYADALRFLGVNSSTVEDPQAIAIGALQSFFADFLGGTLGIAFSLAATAFFVPRTLEKGSADVLFSKPVSRAVLLLSRYAAGLFFIAFLAVFLVGGLYLGFLIVSGYGDTGFLWTIPTLVYLFAILHGVSTLAGVVTRSTVAAILITLVFFMGTGCVHKFWRVRAWAQEQEVQKSLRESGVELPALLEGEEESERGKPTGPFLSTILTTLDVLHWVLPKTSDAKFLAAKVRRAVSGDTLELEDPEARLSFSRRPPGFRRVRPESARGARLDLEPARWETEHGAHAPAWIELGRRPRTESDASGRPRRLTVARAAQALQDQLAAAGSPPPEVTLVKGAVDSVPAQSLSWTEEADGIRRARVAIVFVFGDWLFELKAGAEDERLARAELAARIDQFLGGATLAREASSLDPDAWYARRFDWFAAAPFNVFVSLGSSLAFLVLALAIGAWRIARIDF